MKSALISPLLAGLLLTGCAQPAAQAGGGGGGTIKAINHQMGDQPLQCQRPVGIDIIGPFQGGGGGCCFSVPARWTPGRCALGNLGRFPCCGLRNEGPEPAAQQNRSAARL